MKAQGAERRRLGGTDLEVHPLCLGGNVFGWTADEEESFAILDAYADAGGNFIDTADAYSYWAPGNSGGESETIIGRWAEKRGRREDLVIATKVGHRGGLGSANILASVEASRRRLKVERIDLLYAHVEDPTTPLAETLETFAALIAFGAVRFVGASNYSSPRLREALALAADESLAPFSVYQSQYNILERDRILDPEAKAEPFEPELQSICAAHDLAFIPYWTLAKGYLTGKYGPGGAHGGESARAAVHKVGDYADERGARVLAALEEVASARGASVASVALAWTAAQPTVAATLASARTVEQLRELLPFVDLTLSAEEIASIDRAS